MINRMLCGLAALFGALVMALGLAVGTASAEEETSHPDEFTVTLADCQVTVQANSIPYHVSSGERTAGLAIRVNGETVAYTAPEAMANRTGSEFYEFNESLSFGPVVDGDVVEFRWFAGPDRDDLPAWDATGPADGADWDAVVAEIAAREAAEGRRWDARDDAEFVNWYTFEVTGCPPATETPDPGATQTPDPGATETPDPGASQTPSATESPEAATLPQTSGVRLLPALLIGGFALIGAGAAFYYATRRKMDPTL